MDELKELFIFLRDITKSIINSLENDKFEKLDDFLNERQAIIDKMKVLTFSNEYFSDLYNEYNILNLQNQCNEFLKIKISNTREEIKRISVNKSMNKQYYQGTYVDSIFFNKKI